MRRSNFISDIAKMANGAATALGGAREEIDNMIRQRMERALNARGLVTREEFDALRARHPHDVIYTYWDYQAGAWQRDHGVRIDHFLLSPEAVDRLEKVEIARGPRGLETPSDHTPILCKLRS